MGIKIDLNKAKDITHGLRREKRNQEFAPLDEVIMKRIPGVDLDEVEASRQAIRSKYEVIQENINSASDVKTLKRIVEDL